MTSYRSGTWWVAAVLCGWMCSASVRVHAQDRDKAAAEALFDEGRKLMAAGDYAAACAKLEASQALDAGVGTQLNLADCYEKQGKTASAWAQFRETITAARNAGSAEREKVARKRAEALEPQLSYLTIIAPQQQNLALTRDGARVDPAVVGSALPVDPGTYEIAASAPGKRRWSTTVTIKPQGDRASVNVPLLETEEEPVARTAPGSEPELPPATPPLAAASSEPRITSVPKSSFGAQKLLGIIATGTGVVGLALGSYFGLQASSRWNDAKSNCDPYPYCGTEGQRLQKDAQSSATVSTVAFIAGGALLAGGLVLWLSAPSPATERSDTALLLGPGSIQVRGSFQ